MFILGIFDCSRFLISSDPVAVSNLFGTDNINANILGCSLHFFNLDVFNVDVFTRRIFSTVHVDDRVIL